MVQCKLIRADLTPAEEGTKASSLASVCLQAADLTDTKLGGANLANAAIAATTDERGMIKVSYYDEGGQLIGPETIHWVGSPPNAESFSDATVCPNGNTYGANKQHQPPFSIAQMMQAPNPPTQWTPPKRLV
jgi:hypothetical protein